MHKDDVLNAGVDWITVTSVTENDTLEMGRVRDAMVEVASDSDIIPQRWSAMGYSGSDWGQIKMGVRGENEAILILSGNICSKTVLRYEIAPERVTRLDLQVTVGLAKPAPTYVQDLYKLLPSLTEYSRYAKITSYISGAYGDTIYIGKRGRNQFLRIYDKSLDLGYKKLGSAYRYEVEYRREAAKTAMRRLNLEEAKTSYILGQVTAELEKRCIRSSFGANSSVDAIEVSAVVTTADSKLAWLSRCVTPVVIQLLNLGYEEEVLNCLKLKNIYNRSKKNDYR